MIAPEIAELLNTAISKCTSGVTHILHLTRETYFSACNRFALVLVSSYTVHTVVGRPTNDLFRKSFDTGFGIARKF